MFCFQNIAPFRKRDGSIPLMKRDGSIPLMKRDGSIPLKKKDGSIPLKQDEDINTRLKRRILVFITSGCT